MPFDIRQFQPKAWTLLSRSFESDRVAGTYLFHGRDGLGHWGLAVSLAALLNCEQPQKTDSDLIPCGTCRNCRMIFGINFEGLMVAVPLPPHKSSKEAVELTNEILDTKRRTIPPANRAIDPGTGAVERSTRPFDEDGKSAAGIGERLGVRIW